MTAEETYAFVFRGLLTEEALDAAGRSPIVRADEQHLQRLAAALAFEYIDDEYLEPAKAMSAVYAAIAAFENSARSLVKKVLMENFDADWWEKGVSEGIRKKAESRRKEEEKIKWHAQRGNDLLSFTDFGQLNSIIVRNWTHFDDLLRRQQWVQHIFDTMERSRNLIMHSGTLPDEDVERVGACIRDWMKQTGG